VEGKERKKKEGACPFFHCLEKKAKIITTGSRKKGEKKDRTRYPQSATRRKRRKGLSRYSVEKNEKGTFYLRYRKIRGRDKQPS